MYYYQLISGRRNSFQLFVVNFNISFSNRLQFRAGRAMNSSTAASRQRKAQTGFSSSGFNFSKVFLLLILMPLFGFRTAFYSSRFLQHLFLRRGFGWTMWLSAFSKNVLSFLAATSFLF